MMQVRMKALASLLLCSGCAPSQAHVHSPAGLLIQAVGDSLAVAAPLHLVRESRWTHDVPVLDPQALGRGVVLARGAGSAVVQRDSGGGTQLVTVAPSSPVLYPGDQLLRPPANGVIQLPGFLPTELPGSLAVGTDTVAVLYGDSASLTVRIPVLDAPGCDGPAPRDTLHLSGGDIFGTVAVARRRTGELELEPGGTATLPTGSTHCVRLPDIPDAEYVVALVDRRLINRARTGPEGDPLLFMATATDRTVTPSAPAPAPRQIHPPPDDHAGGHPPLLEAVFGLRERAWQPGERFPVPTPTSRRSARVHHVNRTLVLAAMEGDGQCTHPAWLDAAGRALATLEEHLLPELDRMFGVARPRTGQSGQYLVLASRGPHPASTVAQSFKTPASLAAWTLVDACRAGDSYGELLRLLAHEVTHAYQFQYKHDSRPPGEADMGDSTDWSMEGGATYVASEFIRRQAERDPARAAELHGLLQKAADSVVGALAAGYEQAADFMLHLAASLARETQMTREAADRLVVSGSLEGWSGIDESGLRRIGLARRMSDALGREWDPADALLQWALASTWPPLAVIEMGNGESFRLRWIGGSPARIHVRGGGSLHLQGATVNWSIARIR
jgi:hypothetical protein